MNGCHENGHTDRMAELKRLFSEKFKGDGDIVSVVRAPGRVNLIGEHIDYHGYSVLPMAITQDVEMAVSLKALPSSSNDLLLRLSNVKCDTYKDFSTSLSVNGSHESVFSNMTKPMWHHYVLCGLHGMLENEAMKEVNTKGKELNILVDGSIPPNAGLSSSSAMVCCAALAASQVFGLNLSMENLATLAAKSERYIGTEGGGMDQAISCLAKPGKAKLISFDPLSAVDITLPSDAVFVVAHSCVELNKAATNAFNTRVAEGRIGVQILAHIHNLDWRKITKASQLQRELQLSLAPMVKLVEKTFKEEGYTRSEVCGLLGIGEEELVTCCLGKSTRDVEVFQVKKRLRHVFSEADRVMAFQQGCDTDKVKSGGDSNTASRLGALMNDSHVSCRDDYECSCPELDELVDVMVGGGAYGARLTGAGWGGCAVAITQKGTEEALMEKIKQDFFAGHPHRMKRIDEALFVTSPAGGAKALG